MILFDVHCHLDDKQFDADREQVIERAITAGVKYIICNGTNPKSNREVLALAQKYPLIKPSLGFYPTDALTFDVDKEIDFIRSQKKVIIAIGEVGVDYHWIKDPSEQEKEREIFKKAISLAKELDKPIIVHSREAESDTLDILDASGYKKVDLHCFGGNLKLAERAAKAGYYLSIPPNIVRSEHFARIVRTLPLSRLLLETDAPYLSPKKEMRNEPAFVAHTVEEIARLRSMETIEVANALFMNFQKLFLKS